MALKRLGSAALLALVVVGSAVGMVRTAAAEEESPRVVRSERSFDIEGTGPTFSYRRPGGNPRSKNSLDSYSEFYTWWESAHGRNDRLRMAQALPQWIRPAYIKLVVPAMERVVAEAARTKYPHCNGEVRERLARQIFTVQVKNGDRYVAMTFAARGEVVKNVRYDGKAVIEAYRVQVTDLVIDVRDDKNQVVTVSGTWRLDTIKICVNAALKEPHIRVVTEICPPESIPPPAKGAICPPPVSAKANAEASAEARASVRNVRAIAQTAPINIVINQPSAPTPYVVGNTLPATVQSGWSAATFSFWPGADTSIRIKNINNNVNQNLNNIAIGNAINGGRR